MFLCPLPDHVIILAGMCCVEVGESGRFMGVIPDLAEHAGVNVAHENLTQRIDAMT